MEGRLGNVFVLGGVTRDFESSSSLRRQSVLDSPDQPIELEKDIHKQVGAFWSTIDFNVPSESVNLIFNSSTLYFEGLTELESDSVQIFGVAGASRSYVNRFKTSR